MNLSLGFPESTFPNLIQAMSNLNSSNFNRGFAAENEELIQRFDALQSQQEFDAKGFVDAAINKAVNAAYNVAAQRVGESNMPEDFKENAYNRIFYDEKLRTGAIQQHIDSLDLTPNGRQDLYNRATNEAKIQERMNLGTRIDSFNIPALSDQFTRGNVLDRLQLSDAQQKLFVLFVNPNKIIQLINELIQKGPVSLNEMYESNPELGKTAELGKTDFENVSGPRTPSFVPEHQKMNSQNITPTLRAIGRSLGR